MKTLPFVLASIVLLSFWTSTQGSLQTSIQVNSSGTIEYSKQSLVIKSCTLNCYSLFEITPEIYAGLYDMSVADWSANVVAGIAAVHVIRPDFKALVYANLRTADPNNYPGRVELFAANGWLLKDKDGDYIRDDVGWLVDVGNPGYQSYIADYLNTQINSLGYDGVGGDNCLCYGTDELFWGCSATPINPRTGNPWTDGEVRQALISLHNAIKSAIGSKLLYCNGIYSGYRFYQHQSAYQEILSASSLDGFASEGMWHPFVISNIKWMTETEWLQSVNLLVWIQDNWLAGHPERFYVPVCKLAYGNRNPTPLPLGCTREQIATFAFASTLLGAKTNQIYFNTCAGPTFDSEVMQPLYNIDPGIKQLSHNQRNSRLRERFHKSQSPRQPYRPTILSELKPELRNP
jgi:hypothetical protein